MVLENRRQSKQTILYTQVQDYGCYLVDKHQALTDGSSEKGDHLSLFPVIVESEVPHPRIQILNEPRLVTG